MCRGFVCLVPVWKCGRPVFEGGCCGNVVGNFTCITHLRFIHGGTPVPLGDFGIPQKQPFQINYFDIKLFCIYFFGVCCASGIRGVPF